MAESKSLPDLFHEVTASSIDEKGVYPHHCLFEKDGKMTMMALDLAGPDSGTLVYRTILATMLKKEPDELIFGVDRFCRAGQGTTLGDCITGAYWNRKVVLWKPFIIEYQHEPRIVKPLDWGNVFWNSGIIAELVYFKLECP